MQALCAPLSQALSSDQRYVGTNMHKVGASLIFTCV